MFNYVFFNMIKECYKVITGDVDVCKKLLEERFDRKFDHILIVI